MGPLRWIACIALAVSTGLAQSDQGTLAGSIWAPGGAAVARAAVQAKDAKTGAVYKATSDVKGQYRLTDLPAGSYDISIFVPGLKAFEQKLVRVMAGTTSNVEIYLEEGTQLSTLGEDPLAIAADMKRHAPPTGPTPRTADGKPDFSGVWWQPATVEPGKPEWLPFANEIAAQRQANNRKDSPQAHCLPSAILRRGPLHEFVQSQAILVEISDDDSPGFHQIYLDGRGHPKEPDPLWYGSSIGKWEGETLVVDRVNFIDQVWLDQDAHPHTDKLHIIERYRRPDVGHLEAEITVDDPGVLAKPWTFKRVSDLAPNEEIREFICSENNKDLPHMVGK